MKRILITPILILSLAGCTLPSSTPTSRLPSATPIISPTLTPTITPTPTGTATQILPIEYPAPQPGTIALDFVALMCSAKWTNNAATIPCPGDPDEVSQGSVSRVEYPIIQGGQPAGLPALLTIPAQTKYLGIFGRYPSFTIYPGDEFRALLTCQQSDTICAVDFSLGYYDGSGGYHGKPNPLSPNDIPNPEEGYYELIIPLDLLAGQTVDFVLTVRDQGIRRGDKALWIYPYIYRNPDATPAAALPTPAVTQASANQTPVKTEDKTPGVIYGSIDYGSAPGNIDPNRAGAVVFFNQDDQTWWWVHTSINHPSFQMTVSPGRYKVLAYVATSGGGMTTVGHTGTTGSCGQSLKLVKVEPNGRVYNLALGDWCSSGDRPSKPKAVPLP